MRQRIHAIALSSEIGDFADEVRRVFLELGRVFGAESLAGECSPPVDVYETDDSVDITVDLPGVDPAAVRIVCKGDSVLIAGEKAPRRARSEATFHLVERGYGRFARVIRLARSCDTSKARASLGNGELHISVPKIADRRGKAVQITIGAQHRAPAPGTSTPHPAPDTSTQHPAPTSTWHPAPSTQHS
jgi:HSP20 family protein